MSVIRFIKNWTLPIAMCFGALSYFVYTGIPALAPTHTAAIADFCHALHHLL